MPDGSIPAVDDATTGKDASDRAYTWTVTAFYAVAIAANLFILWRRFMDDDPDGIAPWKAEIRRAERRQKLERWMRDSGWDRRLRRLRDLADFHRQAEQVEREATEIVTQAAGSDGDP